MSYLKNTQPPSLRAERSNLKYSSLEIIGGMASSERTAQRPRKDEKMFLRQLRVEIQMIRSKYFVIPLQGIQKLLRNMME